MTADARHLAAAIMQQPPALRKAELDKTIGRGQTTDPVRLAENAALITAVRLLCAARQLRPPWQP